MLSILDGCLQLILIDTGFAWPECDELQLRLYGVLVVYYVSLGQIMPAGFHICRFTQKHLIKFQKKQSVHFGWIVDPGFKVRGYHFGTTMVF